VKKLLGWLALAIGAMWVVNDPTGAAALIQHVVHALATLAASL
jgi:hypothetical protein